MSRKREIPAGALPTSAWVEAVTDNLQVITGRRRNTIFVPPALNLTISVSPTQVECQALVSAYNQLRTTMAALMARLDS